MTAPAVTRLPLWRTSKQMTRVPAEDLPVPTPGRVDPVEVWCSRDYLAQVYVEESGGVRVTINRVRQIGGDWADNIPWEHMQRIKKEIGLGDRWAVECFPPDRDLVNCANMRHLWVLAEKPPYGWARPAE